MNTQTMTTAAHRTGQEERTSMSNARAFLARVQVDDALAAKLADADGDVPAILALAGSTSFACTARDLADAYEELVRAEAEQPGLAAPSDMSHPIVYMTLAAPSGCGYPIVYLPSGNA